MNVASTTQTQEGHRSSGVGLRDSGSDCDSAAWCNVEGKGRCRGGWPLHPNCIAYLLGLHCFLRLAHALYCRSRRCLASVAFSV